jgi:uncharacterized membrane protein HdeD (DUF308 family)
MPEDAAAVLLALGLLLLIAGALLILAYLAARAWPALLEALQRAPPLLLWSYRSDGFIFVTSPLLILLAAVVLLLYFLRR